jgi:hypothetical protein
LHADAPLVCFDYGYSPSTVASLCDKGIVSESTPNPEFLDQARGRIFTKDYGPEAMRLVFWFKR